MTTTSMGMVLYKLRHLIILPICWYIIVLMFDQIVGPSMPNLDFSRFSASL